MTRQLLYAACCCLTYFAGKSQTVLSAVDISPVAGDTFYFDYSHEFTPSTNGTGQVWDFSQQQAEQVITYDYQESDGLIDGATVMEHRTNGAHTFDLYIYFALTDTCQYGIGARSYDYVNNFSDTAIYAVPQWAMRFPLQYGSVFTDSTYTQFTGESSDFHEEHIVSIRVTGSGDLVTPFKTYTSVLKVTLIDESQIYHDTLPDHTTRTVSETFYQAGQHSMIKGASQTMEYDYGPEGILQDSIIQAKSTLVLIDPAHLSLDESVNAAISIYPNPCSEKFSIRSDEPVTQLFLSDQKGYIRELPLSDNTKMVAIDSSALPAGIYFVRMQLESGEITVRKLVKI